ncbi:hypothetical protein C9374_010848 [Naegleria lovaniensis]|uniref:DUF4116 domain-containing protein n=1 Tax=Naegleria lovaniensis TaxID=51637 RepID=A0AA88GG54_NAELO|nr:uncharacterized protein C9374_010848 [Naegleria lovaniensis]KAG2374278.1 hypothetical protein C9374_010848 [Naegleria lovaniensis]
MFLLPSSSEHDHQEGKNILIKLFKNGVLDFSKASEVVKQDREIAHQILDHDPTSFQYLSDSLKNDHDIAWKAVSLNGSNFQYCCEEFRNDKSWMMKALESPNGYCMLQYASEQLRNDEQVVMNAVSKNGDSLKYVSEELKQNKQVVLQAVSNDGLALKYAPENLENQNPLFPKQDRTVVMKAVKNDGMALKFASPELCQDREIVLQAVKNYGQVLQFAHDDLKNDLTVVLTAVKQGVLNGSAWCEPESVIQYASRELRNNREAMLKLLKYEASYLIANEDCRAQFETDPEIILQYHSSPYRMYGFGFDKLDESLKSNKKFVKKFLKLVPNEITQASEEIQRDRSFMLELLQETKRSFLSQVPKCYENDKDFILKALELKSLNLSEIPQHLQHDKEFMMQAVMYYTRHPIRREKLIPELWRDKTFMLAFISKDPFILITAHEEIRNDPQIILTALETCPNPLLFNYASSQLKRNRLFVLKILDLCGACLNYVDEELKMDREVVIRAIMQDGNSLKFAHESLRRMKDLTLRALDQKRTLFTVVHESLTCDKDVLMKIANQAKGW